MLKLWTRSTKTKPTKSDVPVNGTRLVAKPPYQTPVERARQNDTDGKQRRLRQVVDQNRLL
jgi:hypothetical protein